MAHQVSCSQDDGFVIQSADEHEAIDMIQNHAREKHDMDLSDDEARNMIEQT